MDKRMTSASLKVLLPNDNREVFVWIEVDGNWILKSVKSINITDHNEGGVTLDLNEE